MVRRSQRLTRNDPAAASASATATATSTIASCGLSARLTASTVRPTATSATTRPPSRTGTTARTDGPSVPV